MIAAIKPIAVLGLLWTVSVLPAAAQGKSGSAPGQVKDRGAGAAAAAAATVSPATASSATSAPSASANGILYYGSWLDDASVMAPGAAWVGASSAYWKADTAHQVDAPVLMGAVGMGHRAQIGASLPVYHFRDETGYAASGVGTVSVYGKLMLIDPAARAKHGVGIALAPLMEVVPGASQRVGWALPVNLEARADRFRLYGSAGYFSRGSVFGTAALEIPAGRLAALTAMFGQSHSSDSHQTSVGVSLSYYAAHATGLYVSLGHSTSAAGFNNGGLSIGGGVSVLLQSRTPSP